MFEVDRARAGEHAAALRLAFGYLVGEEGELRAANALTLLAEGNLDAEGILVVRQGGELCGAMVAMPLPGAGGLVWLPWVVEGPLRQAQEDQLVETASSWLRRRGAKVIQAFLRAEETSRAGPLLRGGFQHVTRLRYLRHSLAEAVNSQPSAPARYQTFGSCDPAVFRQTLLRTYEGTLDCPELNGVRTVEEILAGHQAQGLYRPDRWWLAFDEKQPIGVLLTTEVFGGQGWDLSYVGVVPERRGRGWGRRLVQLALAEARAAGAPALVVAVDARNLPAWKLYTGLDFEPGEEREVYLMFPRRATGTS
jgi:ribosomal protein S18 acetylase RimI-like enzyme